MITIIKANSSITFHTDFNHLKYGISKYDNVTINTTLTGETNIANPYTACQISAVSPIVDADTTDPIYDEA